MQLSYSKSLWQIMKYFAGEHFIKHKPLISEECSQQSLYWGFHCTFYSLQRTKKILKIKIFAKKAKKLRKNKNDNSNCFYAQIKGFYHKFQFSVVDRRSKTLFGIYFSISIVDLCNNFFNKISCLKKNRNIFSFHDIIGNFSSK